MSHRKKSMVTAEQHKQLREKFNPDGSELRRLQELLLSMLIKFDEFCTKYDIKYWLSSGSVLGAIRHLGFIPWDDDMDIEMLKEEYAKLESLRKQLKEETGIILHNHKEDKEYIAPYPKLRDLSSEITEIHKNDRYYNYKGLYIDIFIRERVSKQSTFISHVIQYLSYRLTRIPYKQPRLAVKALCYSSMHNVLFPVLGILDKLFYNKRDLRCIKGSGYYAAIDEKEIFPLRRVTFENHRFPVPNNYDYYLTKLYGNYMQLPSLDDLHPHFLKVNFEKKSE